MSEPLPSLRRVRAGLPLVGFGVCLLWLLFAWAILGLLVDSEHPEEFVRSWPQTVVSILWPALLVMQIVGQLLCLGAPKDWQLRKSETPALALNLIHLGLFLGLLPYRWQLGTMAGFWVLLLLAPALHLIFITNLAPRIDQEPLGQRAESLIFMLLLLLVFPVLLVVGSVIFARLLGPWPALLHASFAFLLLTVLFAIGFLLMLAALVMYMNLHLAMYNAIPRYLETFTEKRKLTEGGWVDLPPGQI